MDFVSLDMAKKARGRAGARSSVSKALKTQLKRTAKRSVAAIAAGREPGKSGPKRTVAGSKGGNNGARAADRAAARAAKKAGVRPKPAKRILQRPAATLMRKPAATGTLHLLEAFAYYDSALSHEWAKRGLAAVRVAHRRDGGEPKPGPEPVLGAAQTWYLDLEKKKDKDMLLAYAAEKKPDDLWSSPDCTPFTTVQRINKGRHGKRWRPAGEKAGLQMLSYCRKLHAEQQERGGRCHHEQSAQSHAPFDSEMWPWAISNPPVTAKVAGCAVGLKEYGGGKLLAKEWRVESSSFKLLESLEPYKCPGGHEHGESLGSNRLWRTACYPAFFASLVAAALVAE